MIGAAYSVTKRVQLPFERFIVAESVRSDGFRLQFRGHGGTLRERGKPAID